MKFNKILISPISPHLLFLFPNRINVCDPVFQIPGLSFSRIHSRKHVAEGQKRLKRQSRASMLRLPPGWGSPGSSSEAWTLLSYTPSCCCLRFHPRLSSHSTLEVLELFRIKDPFENFMKLQNPCPLKNTHKKLSF